jgi:Zn-finger nucleic acid-binding protein
MDAGAVEIDCCSRCDGIWLDAGELRRIDPAAAPPIDAAASRTAAAGSCPRCPQLALWSHPLAPDVSAVVAECRLCGGVLLAASELERVKRHVEVRAIRPPRQPAREPTAPMRRRRGSSGVGDLAVADLVSGALSLFLP